MLVKNKIIIVSLLFLLFFVPVAVSAQSAYDSVGPLKITSISENFLSGKGIFLTGTFSPFQELILSLKDESNIFIYFVNTISDSNGNWSGNFDQPLKKGKYYVEALPKAGSILSPVKSEMISVSGPFAFIIGVFSVLVAILSLIFLLGWYSSKMAEIRRYRRILLLQRDVQAFYNVIKKDVDKSLLKISVKEVNESAINEIKFLLEHTDENLEKMSKYIKKGIDTISRYDIIENINKIFKLKSK